MSRLYYFEPIILDRIVSLRREMNGEEPPSIPAVADFLPADPLSVGQDKVLDTVSSAARIHA